MLNLLRRILTFVQSKMLLERESLCRLVGTQLFGQPNAAPNSLGGGSDGCLNLEAFGLESNLLGEGDRGVLMVGLVEYLERHCLDDGDHAPISGRDLKHVKVFQKELIACTVPFCKDMVMKQLMERDPPPKLVTFCKNYAKEFVNHRRRVLLNRARDILIENDYHNTVVVGEVELRDGEVEHYNYKDAGLEVFKLPKSSISDTAHKIMAMVRQTMDEAVDVATEMAAAARDTTSERDGTASADDALKFLPPILYKTARELFTLFRSIIPASHGREVAHVPRTAAVLHNDCVFLAHHCLTLGLEYKEKFPPPVDEDDARGKLVKQMCIFVDMVPLFRELADTSMGDMLDLQKRQLADIVGSRITYFGQSLRSDDPLHEWSEAETALEAGAYHLRHLSQAWKPILAYSVFLRSMGYLSDVILTLYLRQVTAATSISSNARHFTCALFQKATAELSGLLETPKPAKYASEWGHFVALGKLFEMKQLSQLEQALSSGAFRNVGGQELARLIQAGFPDSPQRRALLKGLASAT